MNFDFFLKVNQFRVSFGQYAAAEDFIDVLNYMITPTILIFFAGISATKQYLFTPIQCWTLKETEGSQRMEYIENLCWIENMFYWPMEETLTLESKRKREERTIYYYQWIPFVLALQAVLFYLPRICWLFLSNRFGTSIMDIIRFSMSAATVEQDKRQRLVGFLAAHLEKLLFHVQPYRRGRWQQVKNRCAQALPCLVLTRRTGFVLVGSYLLVKLLYVKVAIMQMLIMERFLGMNGTNWGFNLLDDLIRRRTWQRTGVFPRVTRCEIKIENVGVANSYILQCVLPNNMLNEKMYIFLWFWVWALAVFTSFSFVSWAVTSTMRASRRSFIKKYLKIMTSIQSEEKALAKKFVNSFLRYDGIFLLRMISHNAGDLVTAEIVHEIWLRYRSKKTDEIEACGLPALLPPERPPRSSSKQRHRHHQHQQQQQQSQQQPPTAPPPQLQPQMMSMPLPARGIQAQPLPPKRTPSGGGGGSVSSHSGVGGDLNGPACGDDSASYAQRSRASCTSGVLCLNFSL